MPCTLAAYLHDLTPEIVRFTDTWSIRWYGLSYLFGFFLGYLLLRRVARVGATTLKPEEVADLVIALAFGIVIGGRLGYVLFYDISLLTSFSAHFPFWGLFAINRGGMASHGGIAGGAIACILYARRHQHSLGHVFDLMAFGGPLGLFFGRLANFINGELYGREAPPGFGWAVKFPQEMLYWSNDNEKLAALIRVQSALPTEIGRVTLVPTPPPGGPMTAEVARTIDVAANQNYYVFSNIIDAIQHHNRAVARVVEPLITPRYPSQLYEAVLEGLVVFAVLALIWAKPRKPYIVGGAFGVTYALVRILGEQFRMPDAHLLTQEFEHLGVTRGQLLSALLLLVGGSMMAYGIWKPGPVMGGWRKRAREAAEAANGGAGTPRTPGKT
ncbi:MAG: prolipoprotein diacylglyceryl transferase [Planctomycetota bacterium]|nr:prolipoprotein diacylglyceryl transferase [Planctomycetota bacterium]